jgi:acetylglutamate synthase
MCNVLIKKSNKRWNLQNYTWGFFIQRHLITFHNDLLRISPASLSSVAGVVDVMILVDVKLIVVVGGDETFAGGVETFGLSLFLK